MSRGVKEWRRFDLEKKNKISLWGVHYMTPHYPIKHIKVAEIDREKKFFFRYYFTEDFIKVWDWSRWYPMFYSRSRYAADQMVWFETFEEAAEEKRRLLMQQVNKYQEKLKKYDNYLKDINKVKYDETSS